jgi:SAM-dependent methyltransferase
MEDRGRRRKSFRQEGHSPVDELVFRLRARRILSHFPPHAAAAVDLGSGHDYRLLRHLLRGGGIGSGTAVDVALDPGAPAAIRLIEADLGQPLDIASASVDVVLSLAVLEHLDDPALHLREAHRIMRSPGLLLLTSPSRSSRRLLEFLAYRLRVIDADEIRDHKHYFDAAEIRALLAAAGFAPDAIAYRTFLLGLNQFVSATK